MVLQALVFIPVAAVFLSLNQSRLYQASAEVLLGQEDFATGVNNIYLQWQDPARVVETQAGLARTPVVAERVLHALNLTDRTAKDFMAASQVVTKQNADVLEFRVTDPDPRLARRLATEYATQYKAYRLELDTVAPRQAREDLEERIEALRAEGKQETSLYESLVERQQQLRTIEKLQAAKVLLMRRAADVTLVQPRPVRNGILGFGVALVVGIGLAFVWEALDTRVRSANEIARRLGLPLLARLPAPPRRLRNEYRLASVEEPESTDAELFRMLRTNLEFMNLERNARLVMVTSAVEGEGKSTTVANLAVTLARAGRQVVLIDLDLRKPVLHRFFNLDTGPGLTDVALGYVELGQALTPVPVAEPRARAGRSNGNGAVGAEELLNVGLLEVLTSGPIPPDPGEFIATTRLEEILGELRERADLVLIDSPPLLNVGDGMALSAHVDALLLVTRLNVANRPILGELQRILGGCRSAKLGFVLTGAESEDDYGYSSYVPYQSSRRPGAQQVA